MNNKQFRGKNAAVLSWLKTNRQGGTVFEIQDEVGFGDIRKKISNLNKYYEITSVWVPFRYRTGEKTEVKRYFFKGVKT